MILFQPMMISILQIPTTILAIPVAIYLFSVSSATSATIWSIIIILSSFIDSVLKRIEQDERPKKGSEIVIEIKNYIEQNYAEEIDLIHLAQDYHINYIHLSRLFKSQLGENFSDYLTRLRMQRAKEFIQRGNFKIKEVAELVGFKNPYYFSTSYKKFFGHTPGETD